MFVIVYNNKLGVQKADVYVNIEDAKTAARDIVNKNNSTIVTLLEPTMTFEVSTIKETVLRT